MLRRGVGQVNIQWACLLSAHVVNPKPKPWERACLQAFKDGDVRFLICTDVAARGIDIQGLPYVVNMTLPDRRVPVHDTMLRTSTVGDQSQWSIHSVRYQCNAD
jgi:Helicase conserved C-terminal domain